MAKLKEKAVQDVSNVQVPVVQDQLPAYANELKIRPENVLRCTIGVPT
jgi:hypothetical protein